jgi:HEPN domain-containing protein
VNRAEFQRLAETRIADARALFEAGRNDAAFYLAGYAVECALKACIAKKTREHDFPAKSLLKNVTRA